MKNRPLPNSATNTGLRGLLNHMLGRAAAPETGKTRMVKVWDARCDSYRDVNLNDRNDPMWPTARELYLLSKRRVPKTAA